MCVYPFIECYSNAAATAAATVTAVVDFSLQFSLFGKGEKKKRPEENMCKWVEMQYLAIYLC